MVVLVLGMVTLNGGRLQRIVGLGMFTLQDFMEGTTPSRLPRTEVGSLLPWSSDWEAVFSRRERTLLVDSGLSTFRWCMAVVSRGGTCIPFGRESRGRGSLGDWFYWGIGVGRIFHSLYGMHRAYALWMVEYRDGKPLTTESPFSPFLRATEKFKELEDRTRILGVATNFFVPWETLEEHYKSSRSWLLTTLLGRGEKWLSGEVKLHPTPNIIGIARTLKPESAVTTEIPGLPGLQLRIVRRAGTPIKARRGKTQHGETQWGVEDPSSEPSTNTEKNVYRALLLRRSKRELHGSVLAKGGWRRTPGGALQSLIKTLKENTPQEGREEYAWAVVVLSSLINDKKWLRK